MMKFITFLLILTAFISCKQNQPDETIHFDGTATALMNGQPWNANIFSVFYKNESCSENIFSLSLQAKEDSFTLSERINFSGLDSLLFSKPSINLKPPVYNPTLCKDSLASASLYIVEGGDVLLGRYRLVEKNTPNQLKIISFDKKTNELTARFQLDYVSTDTAKNHYLRYFRPDTLHFTEGVIKTTIRILDK